MASWIVQVLGIIFSLYISITQGKDKILYCSACKAIVDELNYSISKIDPKRTINVGSFRLNPDGSLTDKKVQLARSESHLSELLDEVCSRMSDYALHKDPNTQEKLYRRFAPRSEDSPENFPDFNNFQFDGPGGSNALKFACETIVEELEDHIIALFSKDSQHEHSQLCNTLSDHCRDLKPTHQEL
ncbi:protein canopy-1 [Synchiropus splendidus]|uniref:protein canopy-1 n=1 Tax=Synchiropus splendidus TaxID=270530 RepID=UPI00237E082D|nr:protein canopy-1 [Synchiropus splendidus]